MRPQLLATAQEFENQVILGREIPVERHLGGAGPGDDRIDTDRPDAFAAEEFVRGPVQPLTPAVRSVIPLMIHRLPPAGRCHTPSLSSEFDISIPSVPRSRQVRAATPADSGTPA